MSVDVFQTTSQTPYLDRLIPLPRENPKYSKFKWWQIMLFAPLLFVEITRVLVLLVLLQLLIHELGHLIGGLLVGDQFNRIRVAFVEINSSWKISWHWGWNTMFSGDATTIPRTRTGIRWKLFISTLAGPLANVATAVLIIAVMIEKRSLIGGTPQLFIVVGAVIGLGNLVPEQRFGQMSDGMILRVLLFEKDKRERLISTLIWLSDYKLGRTKSFDGYSLEKSSSVNDGNGLQVVANWAGYSQANDAESAGRYLENCLAQCSAVTHSFRNSLILEAANYQISRRNQVDLAQAWLNDYVAEKSGVGHLHVEALILQQSNRLDQALSKVDSALIILEGQPDTPGRAHKKLRFEKLRTSLFQQNLRECSNDAVSTS